MSKKANILFGILTIGAIAIISGFAIHSVNETFKRIDLKNISFDEINWDI